MNLEYQSCQLRQYVADVFFLNQADHLKLMYMHVSCFLFYCEYAPTTLSYPRELSSSSEKFMLGISWRTK